MEPCETQMLLYRILEICRSHVDIWVVGERQ